MVSSRPAPPATVRRQRERQSRDIHAAAKHVAMSPNNYVLSGRMCLGMDLGTQRFDLCTQARSAKSWCIRVRVVLLRRFGFSASSCT